jgi:hypothetical protein
MSHKILEEHLLPIPWQRTSQWEGAHPIRSHPLSQVLAQLNQLASINFGKFKVPSKLSWKPCRLRGRKWIDCT